eukprot:TRINITY_DN1499_c0_g2_i1.p1 TRINITY_DN1499_c0_g2~~TRINITY_DN1499_c0_g2_i1.p1  ORF type:complete len:676 (+),score=210.44 TRINITY_DN1499_c0_g2_i1:29-2056(+)
MNMYADQWHVSMPQGAPMPSGGMNDTVAQLAHMKRAVGQLEVSKAVLERELHNTVAARDALSAELSSLQGICRRLEQESDVKTREKAELRAEVGLLNEMIRSQQQRFNEEKERLHAELEDAVKRTSIIATELETTRIDKQTLGDVQRISADALTELHEAQEKCRDLEQALVIQQQTARELNNTLATQKEINEKARAEYDEERHKFHQTNASQEFAIKELRLERQDAKEEKDAVVSVCARLWEAVSAIVQYKSQDRLPSMNDIANCHELLVKSASHDECYRQQQRLHHELERAVHEQTLAKEQSALVQNSQKSLMEAADTDLQAARAAAEECNRQMKAAFHEAEKARAEANHIQAAREALEHQLARANSQIDAMKNSIDQLNRDSMNNGEESKSRLRLLETELQLERSRVEKLTTECDMIMKKSDEMAAFSKRQQEQLSDQLEASEADIAKARTKADAAQAEYRVCAAERDRLKSDLANTKDLLEQQRNDTTKLHLQLKQLELEKSNDITWHNEIQSLKTENSRLASEKVEAERKLQTLELEHIRTQQALIDKRASETLSTRHDEREARIRLAAAPVGSTVMVSESASAQPYLVGKKGIVIAHAVSPAGEPGALVGFQAPLGEELILLANLRVLSVAAVKPQSNVKVSPARYGAASPRPRGLNRERSMSPLLLRRT